MPLGWRCLRFEQRDEAPWLSRFAVDSKEVLGLYCSGINVAKYRLEPPPHAWPVVTFFLLCRPGDAIRLALGFPQPHGAFIAITDAAGGISCFRRWSGG